MLRSLSILVLAAPSLAQHDPNYDEANAGTPLLPALGATTADEWTKARRPELLAAFAEHVYGRTPAFTGTVRCRVDAVRDDALGGAATRKLLHLDVPELPAWEGMDLMLYLPNGSKAPAGCFVALNFHGNHAVTDEADVPITTHYVESGSHLVDHHATPRSRGSDCPAWPLRDALRQGFAVATVFCGDVEPDHETGWRKGVRGAVAAKMPETVRGEHAWGAIGAWAWSLSRIADHLQTEARIDATRLAVLGHSRLGKAALWAGAQDQRFALVIANESGEGGAALMRRDFGETTAMITSHFPHWFCRQYAKYGDDPAQCPVDSHQLIALVAPRPVYVASAAGDRWADPKGEFLGALYAGPAWALFGRKALGVAAQPPVDKPVGDCVGYHVRSGEHDLTAYDWQQYRAFAARHWAK